MDFMHGWWLVLTMFEGGTVEGYRVDETDNELVIRQLVFRGDEPGQVEFAVEKDAIIQIDAYRERPPV